MIAELEKVIEIWPSVKGVLSLPHSQRQYNKLIKVMEELLDEIGKNENHRLLPLLETISSLIEIYESENVTIKDAEPIETLKYLMEEHHLSQKDLSIIESQGVVSDI